MEGLDQQERNMKKQIDPEAEKILQEAEEQSMLPVLIFMLVFVLLLSIGVAELIVWFLCVITGVPFSPFLGFAGWVLYLIIRHKIANH